MFRSLIVIVAGIIFGICTACNSDKSSNTWFEAEYNGVFANFIFSNAKIVHINDSLVSVAVCGASADYKQSLTISFLTSKFDTLSLNFDQNNLNKYHLQAVYKNNGISYSTLPALNSSLSGYFSMNKISNETISGTFAFTAISETESEFAVVVENGNFCAKIK